MPSTCKPHIHNLYDTRAGLRTPNSINFCSMLRCYHLKRNLGGIATSLILTRHFTSNYKQTLLRPSKSNPISLVSRPCFFASRSDHTMASQSKTSVHDFTVKVGFIIIIIGFLLVILVPSFWFLIQFGIWQIYLFYFYEIYHICRTPRDRMLILASTRESFFWLSMLHHSGMPLLLSFFTFFWKN